MSEFHDGVHWEQLHRRLDATPVVFRRHRDHLGARWSNNPSKTGATSGFQRRQRLAATQSPMSRKERHEHSAYLHDDKIWIAGGHAQPLSNEVWSLSLPPDWKPSKNPGALE
jgi:hypothetical protein